MTCPNCGTKYNGKQCPKCGRWTTDVEMAFSNRWKYAFIWAGAVLLLTIVAIIWVGHGWNQIFENIEDGLNETGNTQVDGDYTVVTSEPGSSAGLDERNALKADILSAAVALGLPDTSKVVIISDRAEISVPTDYSAETMPDTWETILENAESIGASLQSEVPDYAIILMYKDAEENILLTVQSGECKYDAFEIDAAPVAEDENPPTITLAEYNQIETGMTYFQVCDIIGGYGEVLSEVDLGIGSEYATEMYMWEGEGMAGANANVTFQGGKVTAKAQFGLE